jgi:hypothetical protein
MNSYDERKKLEIRPIPIQNLQIEHTYDTMMNIHNETEEGHRKIDEIIESHEKDRPIRKLLYQYRLRSEDLTLFIEEAYRDLVEPEVKLIPNYYHPFYDKENAIPFKLEDVKVKYHIAVAYNVGGLGDFGLVDTIEQGQQILTDAYEGKKKDKMIAILESKIEKPHHELFLRGKINRIKSKTEKVVLNDKL